MSNKLSVSMLLFALLRISSTPTLAEAIHVTRHTPCPEIGVAANETGSFVTVANAYGGLQVRLGGRGRGDYRWHLVAGRIAAASISRDSGPAERTGGNGGS